MTESLPVFLAVTLMLMGGCAFMTGQALASTWRPAWACLPYGLLLGGGDRFLSFALFDGRLLSLQYYAIDTAVLLIIACAAHRLTLARRMARQYPWLIERTGPFGWREKGGPN
jgi:hypothetical protein